MDSLVMMTKALATKAKIDKLSCNKEAEKLLDIKGYQKSEKQLKE
jgi:hypothetical protein